VASGEWKNRSQEPGVRSQEDVRGKYAKQYRAGTNLVLPDSELAGPLNTENPEGLSGPALRD